jgi:2-polyprenyl-3-methyl-5-hydroxy-6-metoxy-1,4-benzoquinol methylase
MSNPNTRESWIRLWSDNLDKYGSDPCHIARWRFIANLCITSKSVLDVASGPGWFGDFLPKRIFYERVDFCEDALKIKPGPYIVADIVPFPRFDRTWDSVVAMEILEHLDDPGPFIHCCFNLCNHQAIFSVPNDRLGPDQEPFHVRKYDIDSFRYLFYRLGYSGHFTTFCLRDNLICQIRK